MTSYTLEDFNPDPNNKYIHNYIFLYIFIFNLFIFIYLKPE